MNLLIRTDASVSIGTGHAMRCLALAQAWQDAGGRAEFAMAESTAAIEARLLAESCNVAPLACQPGSFNDASQTVDLAERHEASWIVVDGYQFDAQYQRTLKNAGRKVLFLDDYGHASHYAADIVLNQNVSADGLRYRSRDPNTSLLLGSQFALLRREFNVWRGWKREVSAQCCQLLVMMGGSDSENLTARIIEALGSVEGRSLQTTVVVGGSNPHLASLEESVGSIESHVSLRKDVSNVADLMAKADLAISAAGSTCWELCLFGLPSLLLDVAANQTEVALELDRRRCAVHIGDQNTTTETIAREVTRLVKDHALRVALSQNAQQLVDGRGAERVVSILPRGTRATDKSAEARPLRLRHASASDAHLLWEWANDPDVRAASFSTETISWETHIAWLAEKLRESGSLIMIAQDQQGAACGQIRFDQRLDGGWEVDVSLARAVRGLGLASSLIALGVDEARKQHPGAIFHAFVRPENAASAKAFERAGFVLADVVQTHGIMANHFVFGVRSA